MRVDFYQLSRDPVEHVLPLIARATRGAEQRLGWQCLALEVEDMDRALDELKAKGIAPAWGPMKRPDYARAEIRDPDGNPIELRQWYRAS